MPFVGNTVEAPQGTTAMTGEAALPPMRRTASALKGCPEDAPDAIRLVNDESTSIFTEAGSEYMNLKLHAPTGFSFAVDDGS